MNLLHQHNPPIIHRDLKPGNVLLNSNYEPCISDFGLSKFVLSDTQSNFTGTLRFMAPEMMRYDVHYTTAVDVYAYGLILFQLFTIMHPTPRYRTTSTIPRASATECLLRCHSRSSSSRESAMRESGVRHRGANASEYGSAPSPRRALSARRAGRPHCERRCRRSTCNSTITSTCTTVQEVLPANANAAANADVNAVLPELLLK